MEARNSPVAMLQWLNERDEISEQVWLLALFRYTLKLIRSSEPLKLDEEGYISNYDWQRVEQRLGYELITSKKTSEIHLYRFFQSVAHEEGWFIANEKHFSLSSTGQQFLLMNEGDQLHIILRHFFPEP